MFRSCTKSVEMSVCVTEFSSSGAFHAEVIILAPPCDLSGLDLLFFIVLHVY